MNSFVFTLKIFFVLWHLNILTSGFEIKFYKDHLVLFYRIRMDLTYAEEVCAQFNASLPTFHSQADARKLVQSVSNEHVWLGTRRKNNHSGVDFEFIDGTPLGNFKLEIDSQCHSECCGVWLDYSALTKLHVSPCGDGKFVICVTGIKCNDWSTCLVNSQLQTLLQKQQLDKLNETLSQNLDHLIIKMDLIANVFGLFLAIVIIFQVIAVTKFYLCNRSISRPGFLSCFSKSQHESLSLIGNDPNFSPSSPPNLLCDFGSGTTATFSRKDSKSIPSKH